MKRGDIVSDHKRHTVAESRRAEKAAVSTLLNLLLANEEKVREAAKNDDSRLWLSEDVKVLTHLGVCHYLQSYPWVLTSFAKRGLYPVNHPSGNNRYGFLRATPKEMWGEGEYADNRWAFVRELNEWVNSDLKSSMKC